MLTLAGGQDIYAQKMHVDILAVTWALRILLVAVPVAVAVVAWKMCHDLAEAEPLSVAAGMGVAPIGPNE